eukprot:3189534-Alexandrium_andersonii.AAC.1
MKLCTIDRELGTSEEGLDDRPGDDEGGPLAAGRLGGNACPLRQGDSWGKERPPEGPQMRLE